MDISRTINDSNIRFKTSMIRSNLYNYCNAYVMLEGTITVPNTAASRVAVNDINKKVIFKNYAPFTNCKTEIHNTQVDDAQKTNIVIPMYNLTEYRDDYLKTSGSLWQYFREEPAFSY